MKYKQAWFLLVVLVICWGLSSPINKIGLQYTTHTNFMELRFVIATLTMFLVAYLSKSLIWPKRQDIPVIVCVSVFQMALVLNFTNYGVSLVGAGESAFLVYATSIWVIPLMALLRRKIFFWEAISCLVGFIGVILLIEPWYFHETIAKAWGDASLLTAAFFWSIGLLCARYMKWHHASLELLPWQLLFATVCTIIYGYIRGISILPPTYNPVFLGSVFYMGFFSIGIGYWAMIKVSKHMDPSFVSMGLILIPIISLSLSFLFLKETLSPLSLLGASLLTACALLHIYGEKTIKENF